MRPNSNNLDVNIYSGNTLVDRSLAGVDCAYHIEFETVYPFGLYGMASLVIPRDILSRWVVKGADRIRIYNGVSRVYEGSIQQIGSAVRAGSAAVLVKLIGLWGDVLNRAPVWKPWAEQRITEAVWPWDTTASGSQLCDYDRHARLRFTPRPTAWGNGVLAEMTFTAPTGETVKRITYDYTLDEGAQAWEIVVYNYTGAADEAGTSITATGAGAIDKTLGVPSNQVGIRLVSKAAQTPPDDGSIYGEFRNVTIYTETGNINPSEILTDLIDIVDGVNDDVSHINANLLTLIPFVSEGATAARVAASAFRYGDGSGNRWAVGCLHSEVAAEPDGGPVLFAEQYPTLDDYEYSISMNEAGVDLVEDYDKIINWVAVRYKDNNDNYFLVTPDIEATLKDDDSISAYGQRTPDGGFFDVDGGYDLAVSYGQKILAARSNPVWRASGAIRVEGCITGKLGETVPASEIRAGQRIRLLDVSADLTGSGLIFLIQKTHYNDDTETTEIVVNDPDDLVTWILGLRKTAPVSAGGGSGGQGNTAVQGFGNGAAGRLAVWVNNHEIDDDPIIGIAGGGAACSLTLPNVGVDLTGGAFRDILTQQADGSLALESLFETRTTIYVDGTLGTDAVGYGIGAGANAYKTLQYAINSLKKILVSTLTIYLAAGTYAENVSISGLMLVNCNLRIYGVMTTSLGCTAVAGSVQGSGATQGTVVCAAATFIANAHDGKFIKCTSGVNNNQRLVIDTNTMTTVTVCGGWASGAPAAGDTFDIEIPNVNVNQIYVTGIIGGSVYISYIYLGTSSAAASLIYAPAVVYIEYCIIVPRTSAYAAALSPQRQGALMNVGYCSITGTGDANQWLLVPSWNSYFNIYFSKFVIASGAGRIIHNNAGHVWMGFGCVFDGLTAVAGSYGVFAEAGADVYMQYGTTFYNRIRNLQYGCYSRKGAQISGTSTTQYSGNTSDETADAASFGYID